MLGKLYEALINPGDIVKAREAAEEVAAYDKALADIRSDLRLLKWMVGAQLFIVTGLLWQGFAIMGRLP